MLPLEAVDGASVIECAGGDLRAFQADQPALIRNAGNGPLVSGSAHSWAVAATRLSRMSPPGTRVIAGFPLSGVVTEAPPSITSQSRGSDDAQADGSARGAPALPDPDAAVVCFNRRGTPVR